MKICVFGTLSLLCAAPVWAQLPAATKPTSFDWTLAAPVGSRFLMHTQMQSKVAQKVPVSNSKTIYIESVTKTRFSANYDVVSRDGAGNPTARVTYGQFRVSLENKTDGEPMRASVAKAIEADLNRFLVGFRGASFLIKTTPRGEPIAIYGLAPLRSRLLKSLGKIRGANGAGANLMTQLLDDSRIRDTFGRMNGQIPAYPVRVGETWEYQTTLPASVPFVPTLHGRRTLSDLTATTALLRDTAIFSVRAKDWSASPKDAQKLSFTMFGTQDSTSWISTQTGLPQRALLVQRMNGTFGGTIPGQKTPFVAPMWGATEMEITFAPRV